VCIKCVEALAETFPDVPENEAGDFLMSCTAFPCCDPETLLAQLKALRAQTSDYKACYRIVEDEMERQSKMLHASPKTLLTLYLTSARASVAMGLSKTPPRPEAFTCFDCVSASACEHAFDLYNTNNECLAEK